MTPHRQSRGPRDAPACAVAGAAPEAQKHSAAPDAPPLRSHQSGRTAGPRRKRFLDLCLALLVVALLSPLLAVVALAIRVTMGRPVLFRQMRPGLDGVPFRILKFRTMRPLRPTGDGAQSELERTTPLGRLLRASSIDELPELVNVVQGKMSLVGPRPLLMEYLPNYTAEHSRRHTVLPGVTGLAQVSGRQDLTFSQRLALDLWYIDHWSFRLDLRILAQTLLITVRGRGVRYDQSRDIDDLGISFSAPD